MKYKKDAKVRREWGSQSGELLIINEEYIPELELPSPTYHNNKCYGSNFGSGNTSGSKRSHYNNNHPPYSNNDFMRKCSDTSSTSDSDINS